MRAMPPTALAVALALVCPAAADPGHGPLLVEIKGVGYSPADLRIVQGDLVVWEWSGPDTNHSVTSDDGTTFDSDPEGDTTHAVGDRYAYTFDTPGTYAYHCRVHPLMTGRIVVAADGSAAAPAAPELSGVSVAAKGRRLTLRYALSEAARLRADVRRKGRSAVVARRSWGVPPGQGSRTMKLTGLKAGKYTLTLTPLDASDGQPATAVRRAFTLT